ncbi:zinc finger CCCH domain-containing protein 65 isoform X36 [Pyrus x bretschneideri]|uniref:zinc finger CCCH domain-containing protein 65 isoform X36 n=1 Tax=Pyrus x bretschneideri TaxID=225117 RepID=UPI002030E2B9|nr:zinc finger CCCH domain-containing protein 65 isoform X36 [Pyrus x bretschneideri]
MAISEAISLVPPDPETPSTSHAHSDQGFLPSSPNPALAPSGVDHAVLDEKLDLKEEGEDDGEPDEVQKLDSIEKVEEDEAGELQKVDLKAEDEAGELQKVDLKAEDGAGELQKVEFYEGVEVPLNPTSVPSPALSDLVDWIRTLDPAVLNRIRNRDPAFLQEIQQFDPTVEIRNLAPAFPSEFSESVDVPQNPPSVPSPEPSVVEILDWIRTLGPAVLDEIQQFDPAFLDEDRSFDPSIVDGIRKLSLKEKEEKEEEEKERETEKEKENEKERENESSSSSSSGSGGGNENGGEVEKKVVEESSRRNQYPLRPEAGDCSYYPKTGNCKFGWNCTLNHPRRRKNKQVSKDKAKQREELEKKQDQTESKYYISPGRRIAAPSVAPALELNFSDLPIRLIDLKVSKDKAKQREELEEKQDQTESKYYISPGRRIGVPSVAPALELNFSDLPIRPVSKDKAKQREELEEKQEQTESKYYISPGRRIGVPSVAAALEFNFLGLPIRPGEKDCSYYMQTASCKYETNCKFNHPDPTAAGESRPQSAYGNGRAASLQGLPNSQGINSEATEWNGYQAPAHLPHRSMPAPPPSVHRSMPAPAPPPYVMNNSVTETNYCGQYAQQTQAEEFPERPGQPVCFYFTQTGDCVNKSNCQYHHPKNQTAATPSCAPSDRGLPLRPGQNICTEYSRFGVCSSGPTCIFDHPSLSDSFL